MKKSGYLQRVERKNELKYHQQFICKMDILQQMCMDAAFMAAADVFQMGPGRCEAFGAAMIDYVHEMASLMVEDGKSDPEMEYAKEKVDRRLRKICGEKFEPWEVRYKTNRRRG